MTRPRGNRHHLRGVVVRDKGVKTLTVLVARRFRHPKYGKMVRRNTRVVAHDEADEARLGDVVEIVECRPMSRTKRWRLVRVVERSPEQVLVSAPPGAVEETPAPPGAVEETPASPGAVEGTPAS